MKVLKGFLAKISCTNLPIPSVTLYPLNSLTTESLPEAFCYAVLNNASRDFLLFCWLPLSSTMLSASMPTQIINQSVQTVTMHQ